MPEQETLARITNGGLSIASPRLLEKFTKKQISPSLITGLQGCPASWAAGAYVVGELVPDEPDNAATRGSFFHRVMEKTFAEAPEARTRERIVELTEEVLEEPEFAHFKEIPEALEWLRNTIQGYYSMGGRPEKVRIATIKRRNEEEAKPALEIFVKARFDGVERNVIGFVDRVTEDSQSEDPDAVVVEDWKSGAKAKQWNPKTKSDEGLAEARQQTTYAMALEQEGLNVTGARLIYPAAKKLVTVDTKDEDFRKRVVADIKETDEKLDRYQDTNLFEFRPNFLCSWCPLSRACPKAQIGNFPKAREAAKKQPTIDVLAKGIEFE